ncbi:MAG: hypothetical protein C5B52_16340 [Bacteroidetes bacterium]|nr:MAG: hypothetical protein C5B52_16340 [Bacteroidota bacterium]
MKGKTIKYFIAIIFLAIFAGAMTVAVIPGLIKEKTSAQWQKQESENDSSPTENNKNIEIKEFEAEIASFNISNQPESLLLHNAADDFSFVRTFYLLVPTPPPDMA